MKRLAIYFFWDTDGIVRDFVSFYLQALREVASEVFVIVNGDLTPESHQKISQVSDHVICRENTGFDVWAYKEALDSVGWDNLACYDELILCNYTCYGPIYPFSEMFDEMQQRECDFWGAVKHPEQPSYLLPNYEGYIHEHIMSYFMVIRYKMATSEDFQEYWSNIPPISTKTESTALHETVFTRHFEALGYQSDAFVDLSRYLGRCYNSSIILANELLIKDRCPLVKRRAFFFPRYDDLLEISSVDQAPKTLRFIQEQSAYDVNLIWDDILETQKMSSVRNHLHLNYILPTDYIQTPAEPLHTVRLSFIFYVPKLFYMEIFQQYLPHLPAHAKVLFLYDDNEIFGECASMPPLHPGIEHRLILIGKNEDISISCLNASTDVLEAADYCCCLWDINSIEQPLRIAEEDYCNHICQSLFSSAEHIQNLMCKFDAENRLGLLAPQPAEFSGYFSQALAYYLPRISWYKLVFEQLRLTVPFDDVLYTNLGAAFWIRGSAANKMLKTFDASVRTDLLAEDKALNYFLPMLVQQGGYYTASTTTPSIAAVALDNHYYVKNRIVSSSFKRYKFSAWSARALEHRLNGLSMNRPDTIEELLQRKFSLRHLLRLCLKYPKNKLSNIVNWFTGAKQTVRVGLSHLSVEDDRILLYFQSPDMKQGDYFLRINGRQYFEKQDLTDAQISVKNDLTIYKTHAKFFEVPIEDIQDQAIELFSSNGQRAGFRWTHGISYNALELKEKGLYARVADGRLFIQKKSDYCRSVLFSLKYGIRDKALFLFMCLNQYHPFTLFAENLGAADNSYQLFQYALQKGEAVFFVTSEKVKATEKNKAIRERMLVHNSKKHCLMMLFARRWITSFSLRVELFPTNGFLTDIHYFMLPTEWDFIPHGITGGDKEVAMLHKYSWDNPARTFACSNTEREAFATKYGFKNAISLGAPRMDKWHMSDLDENKVFIFFTWRIMLTRGVNGKDADKLERDFKQSAYYRMIVDTVTRIRRSFPTRQLFYTVHHELVRKGYHLALEEALAEQDIHFIYLDSADGSQQFNRYFRESKYLITDFSSVAYDFAYKENAIPIYYLPKDFVAGHYTLEPKFYEIHLGVITDSEEALLEALTLSAPTQEMMARRQTFFSSFDQNNSQRVYEAIFSQEKPDGFLPVCTTTQSSGVQAPEAAVRRLGIYFYFDADGVVDDYVTHYLTELRPCCQELCVVVNGAITEEGRARLEACCDRFILRENIGFDSWAYKEALESYGFEFIVENFDEVLLNNFTNYGPIYPFSEMFDAMASKKCDFWGHNRYLGHEGLLSGRNIVDHLQSYFIVFRKSILTAPCFQKYWDTLLLPRSYEQAVVYHELRCTRYFESRGFTSEAYLPWRKFTDYKTNTPVYFAYTQLVRDRSPLLKRKTLFIEGNRFKFPLKEAHSPYDIIEYINENTNYDAKLILENLERTMDMDTDDEALQVSRARLLLQRYGFWLKQSERIRLAQEVNAPFSADTFRRLCQNKK